MKTSRFSNKIIGLAAIIACAALPTTTLAKPAAHTQMAPVVMTHYRSANIDGVDIFDREDGRAGAPVVLLLHGFPTSSHMFRNLIPLLADR